MVGTSGESTDADSSSLHCKTVGELAVRGNWIVSRYFKMEEEEEEEGDAKGMMLTDREGREWFLTGDVATIDADGFVQIVDRSKGECMCVWMECRGMGMEVVLS